MEKALFPDRLPETLPQGYQRLYFGSEFCPWTFPSLNTIEQALAAAHRAGWGFTLATPVLSEPFLPRLQQIIRSLAPSLASGDEILVSDLGSISLVREIDPSLPLVLGRVLSGQKRGPRVLDLELDPTQLAHFQAGSWYSREARQLLQEEGVGRIELDNLLQGIAPVPHELKASLHYPYAMVTSSRNCPFASPGLSDPCPAPCGEAFVLETDETPVPLHQCGNTQFLRNDSLPIDPGTLGVDRLVYHPNLPR